MLKIASFINNQIPFTLGISFLLVTIQSLLAQAKLPIRDLSGSKILGYYDRQVDFDEEGRIKLIQTIYFNPNHQLLVSEKASFDSGELQVYEIDHKQTSQKGVVRFFKSHVNFEHTDEKGQTKSSQEKIEGIVLAPLALIPFIESQLNLLRQGQTVEFRIAVWERLESVGMRLKIETNSSSPESLVVLKMEPSSFLIRQLVRPFYFFVNTNGRVTKVQGRLAFKEVSGKKFKDIEGLLPITE